MMQSFICDGRRDARSGSFFGYSLAFSGDGSAAVFGNLSWAVARRASARPAGAVGAATSRPQAHFVYQEMFAIITPALITGALRRPGQRSRATWWFLVLWSILVYIPFVHWIWGGGCLGAAGRARLRRRRSWCTSAPACAALASVVVVVGRRKFAQRRARRAAAHHRLRRARRPALLCFGWFGFNARLGAGGQQASPRRRSSTPTSPARSPMSTWLLDHLVEGRQAEPGRRSSTGAVAGLACITPCRRATSPRGRRSSFGLLRRLGRATSPSRLQGAG